MGGRPRAYLSSFHGSVKPRPRGSPEVRPRRFGPGSVPVPWRRWGCSPAATFISPGSTGRRHGAPHTRPSAGRAAPMRGAPLVPSSICPGSRNGTDGGLGRAWVSRWRRSAFVGVRHGSIWLKFPPVTLHQVAAEERSTRWPDGDIGNRKIQNNHIFVLEPRFTIMCALVK